MWPLLLHDMAGTATGCGAFSSRLPTPHAQRTCWLDAPLLAFMAKCQCRKMRIAFAPCAHMSTRVVCEWGSLVRFRRRTREAFDQKAVLDQDRALIEQLTQRQPRRERSPPPPATGFVARGCTLQSTARESTRGMLGLTPSSHSIACSTMVSEPIWVQQREQ